MTQVVGDFSSPLSPLLIAAKDFDLRGKNKYRGWLRCDLQAVSNQVFLISRLIESALLYIF